MKILFDGAPPAGISVVIHAPQLPATDLATWIQRTLGAHADADLETSTNGGWPVRLVHGVVDEIHRVGAIYRFHDFVAAVVATFAGRAAVDARLTELIGWIRTGRPDQQEERGRPGRSALAWR
jgi:hypothetical protein